MTVEWWESMKTSGEFSIADSINFAQLFLRSTDHEREQVISDSPSGYGWEVHDPYRLADGESGFSTSELVAVTLVFHFIENDLDYRDNLIDLCILYNSMRLGGASPDALFRNVAACFPKHAGLILSFLSRTDEEKELKLFGCVAVPTLKGYRIECRV